MSIHIDTGLNETTKPYEVVMSANCEVELKTSDLESLMSMEVREVFGEIAAHRDRASRHRATSWQFEDPMRNCETRLRVEPAKGRKWKTALTEVQRLVLEALALHEKILGLETRSVALTRAALAKIRIRASRDERTIPADVLAQIERACDRREEAASDLGRFLTVSRRIISLDGRASQDDLLALVEERRGHLLDARMKEREADTLERKAFSLEVEPRAAPPSPDDCPEMPEDAQWDAWLRSVQDEVPDHAPAARVERRESDPDAEEWNRLVRDVTSETIAADIDKIFTQCAADGTELDSSEQRAMEAPAGEATMGTAVSGLKRIESLRAELTSALGQAEAELESQLAEAEERNRSLERRLEERERLLGAEAEAERKERLRVEKELGAAIGERERLIRERDEAAEKARAELAEAAKEHAETLRAERAERERSEQVAREARAELENLRGALRSLSS